MGNASSATTSSSSPKFSRAITSQLRDEPTNSKEVSKKAISFAESQTAPSFYQSHLQTGGSCINFYFDSSSNILALVSKYTIEHFDPHTKALRIYKEHAVRHFCSCFIPAEGNLDSLIFTGDEDGKIRYYKVRSIVNL